MNTIIYRGWKIEVTKYSYNVDCDDYLHTFDTEEEAEDFIDKIIEE